MLWMKMLLKVLVLGFISAVLLFSLLVNLSWVTASLPTWRRNRRKWLAPLRSNRNRLLASGSWNLDPDKCFDVLINLWDLLRPGFFSIIYFSYQPRQCRGFFYNIKIEISMCFDFFALSMCWDHWRKRYRQNLVYFNKLSWSAIRYFLLRLEQC